MPRLPAKIDEIKHEQTGTTTPLRLDKDSWTFQATFGEETFKSKDAEEVITWTLRAIGQSRELQYEPVIYIKVEAQRAYESKYFERYSGFSVNAQRLWLARGDSLYSLSWKAHEAKEFEKVRILKPTRYHGTPQDFVLPYSYCGRDVYPYDHYYLPYSQSVWCGVCYIVDAMELARSQLDALLSDKESHNLLYEIGVNKFLQLPEGDHNDPERTETKN